MNIADQLSIKSKTYLLVMLSTGVALVLLLLATDGFNTLRIEMNDLVSSTKIERYTSKLLHEEHEYRLNANGSVYNLEAANHAFENSLNIINELNQTFNEIDILEMSEDHALHTLRDQIKKSSSDYKELYLKSVVTLNELHRLANVLEVEGEFISLQIQQYIESKRVEIKKQLSQKTIEKINNGSNIWQYTYVTQLQEKKYRLSPDAELYAAFKKDYQFMMSEWDRLKTMSDQRYEFEKLKYFKTSSKKYEDAMTSWVELNNQLVTEILPKMNQLGQSIITKAIKSAELAVNHMSQKRSNITLTLLVVSIFTIILGVVFGGLIARSISTAVISFQDGLLNFFKYLNQEQKIAQPIAVRGNDELSVMAGVVNENITKIQNVMNRKADFQQALLEWSKVDYKDNNLTVQKATELSAKALHVDRVGIWLFNEDKTVLHCFNVYSNATNTHESGATLSANDFPDFFDVLRSGKMLIVENTREDVRTHELVKQQKESSDTLSILNLPIIQDNELIGVICHETNSEIRSWQEDEMDFASSVTNAISMSFEIQHRRLVQEELKAQKEILHFHAHHDSLTGLPNRFLFNDRLNQLIKRSYRSNTKIAVLYIDLDHFKGINDSMGHNVGDELLIEVASRFRSTLRESDLLARLGGDEFAVVLNNITSNGAVIEVTQTLLKVMNAPISILEQSFYITLSIGIAVSPDDGSTSEELLKHADAAMYQAKDDGRNTYQFYNHLMTEKALERVAMEASFRHALKNEEFVVHYQPQVNADSGEIIGTEALIRWMHPEMGMVRPDRFLGFANETGLIMPMDEWVMKTAMAQYAKWYRDGLNPGVLALNMSMRLLHKDDLLDVIKNNLDETGCKPEWLELEVTEGDIMDDVEAAIDALTKIKSLGISLAIDDFGTGYSSLSQLKHLPINRLKIDRSFVNELPGNDDDTVISKSIISLSKNMGLSVIAEGVETLQQKEFLLENGCHYMQGYYYSKPVVASAITDELKMQKIA